MRVEVGYRQVRENEVVVEDEGVKDKRLLVFEGEFANVLKVLRREGNTLSPTLRNAWDNGRLNTLTKNSVAASDSSRAVSALTRSVSAFTRCRFDSAKPRTMLRKTTPTTPTAVR